MAIQSQFEFIRPAFLPVNLRLYGKPQHLCIEIFRPLVVGTYNSNMMYSGDLQHGRELWCKCTQLLQEGCRCGKQVK